MASNDGVPNHLAFNVIEPLIIVGDSKARFRKRCAETLIDHNNSGKSFLIETVSKPENENQERRKCIAGR